MDHILNNLGGVVLGTDGHPVRNARVELRAFASSQLIASGYTLPNGTFEFANLPRAVYEVVVTLGVDQVTQRVELYQSNPFLQLTLANAAPESASSAMVSVSQLKVPNKARKLFLKAGDSFRKQKFSEAREDVEKSLQEFSEYAQALTLRGLLNLQDNKLDAATSDLEHAIKADGNYAMGYVVLGTAYNAMNHYDDSIRTLQRAISLSPGAWQAYYELSKALLGKGQFEAALRQIDKAAQLCPQKYAAIHMVRAHALLGMKDYNQAVAELEQFIVADPGNSESAKARETLGQVKALMDSHGK
ncbi:MAG: tetratricopeptide repeat protein [Terriglobales bacterium]